MTKWVLRIVWVIVGLSALLIALVWLILAAPFFTDLRRTTVENVLSKQIGQPLYVREDAKIVLGATSRLYVSGVEIPSEGIDSVNLAELKVLELEVDLLAVLNGEIAIDNLTIDGLQINMLTKVGGGTTWTESTDTKSDTVSKVETEQSAQSEKSKEAGDGTSGIIAFLSDKTASFTSIGLTIDNEVSGFSFNFELETLTLKQQDAGERVEVTSIGKVNGQDFQIEGDYPRDAAFTTLATLGELEVNYDGRSIAKEEGGGFTGQLTLDTGEIGDFLEILGLERVLEGQGGLTASLTSQPNILRVSDMNTVIELSEGQQLKSSGAVENLLDASGIDVTFIGRFHPEGQTPERADNLKDLKLTGVSAHIVSLDHSLEFEDLLFTTNAFDQGLDQVGPVSIGRIRRTEEGQLALEDVSLQAGPSDAPYVVATGNIRNVLQLKQLDLEGELSAPASLILKELGDEVADAFGGVKAEFSIDDSQGHLSLNSLNAYTVDTDVWTLKAHAELGNVGALDKLALDFDLDIEDGAQFLGALKLEEVGVGPLEISASIVGRGKDFSSTLGLLAGTSRLAASLDTTVSEGRPKIDGQVESERLNIVDLKNAVAAVVQLGKIGDSDAVVETTENEKPVELEVQPLVLAKEDGKPTDLVDLEDLLLKSDLNVSINIKEIAGQQGISSISSDLSAEAGKAKFGPLKASYGGGYFEVAAEMDLAETPDLVSISGATSGWDFGKILDSVGLGIDAHGKLRGNFDIVGNRSSLNTFINSMYGSASISMSEGDIATSLLELAGLGVFPWLFSDELQQGYTDVVCVVAPVRIDAGKVTFDSVVAETASVQLVAKGAVDWKSDTISVRAEPRRVGKPLSRSAWPFEVGGKLSEPKFKLEVGGSSSKRSDGADEMPADRIPCTPDINQLE